MSEMAWAVLETFLIVAVAVGPFVYLAINSLDQRAETIAELSHDNKHLMNRIEALQAAYTEMERNYLTCIEADGCDVIQMQLQQALAKNNLYEEQLGLMRAEWSEFTRRLSHVVQGVA